MADAKDKHSKFARGLLGIDIMEALGIKKGTDGKVCTIENLVHLFCEREQYNMQNFQDYVDGIDGLLYSAIKSKETVKNIWTIIREIILERLTRKPRKKRSSIAQPKLLEWVQCMDPEMLLSDIPEHSRDKIEDLDEL